MGDKTLLPGQVVKITGGKYKGCAGEVRAFPSPGWVTVRIGAEFRTIKIESVGVDDGSA